MQQDVLFFGSKLPPCELIITNPPWERNQDGTGPLHDMIRVFSAHAPTWLLFDADWMHTGQASRFAPLCKKIVSVGRVKWIEGSAGAGMENACWYLFAQTDGATEFIFRQEHA